MPDPDEVGLYLLIIVGVTAVVIGVLTIFQPWSNHADR